MKSFSLKLIGVMSCLFVLATLSIFGQNQNDEFKQKFNIKPIQDFADNLLQKLENKEVDLDKPFSVTLEGYLLENGRFDIKRTKFTKSEGDEKVVAVAKDAIEYVSYSGIFSYLSDLGVEKVKIDFSQNDKEVTAILTSEMINEPRARTVASSFKMLFTVAKLNVKEDEVKTLLNATKVSAQSNNFTLNFTMPKTEAHQLLKNELQKRKEKRYSSNGE